MKVVVDTNVFISSFLGRGNPRKILDLWKKGEITLCLSAEIIDEYMAVLKRLTLSEEKETLEILELFATRFYLMFTHTPAHISLMLDDTDDLIFFKCAVSLSADYIVSGDKKVFQVKNYLGIKVVNPDTFIKKYHPGITRISTY